MRDKPHIMIPNSRTRTIKIPLYKYTLRFSKTFHVGILEGMTHVDEIGFCNMQDLEDYIIDINRSISLDYSIQKIAVITNNRD